LLPLTEFSSLLLSNAVAWSEDSKGWTNSVPFDDLFYCLGTHARSRQESHILSSLGKGSFGTPTLALDSTEFSV